MLDLSVKFNYVHIGSFTVNAKTPFDLNSDSDPDLGNVNLNPVCDMPSHYASSFYEILSNLLQ